MSTTNSRPPQRHGQDLAPRPSAPAPRVPPTAGPPADDPASPSLDLAAAATEARAQSRSETRLHRRLAQILKRPYPPARAQLALLTAEAKHIGPGRDPTQVTHGEIMIQRVGKAAADDGLARAQRVIDQHAEAIEVQQAQHAKLITRAQYLAKERVRHPDGGRRPVEEVVQDEQAQRAQIEDDCADGSRKHQRLPGWIGHIPRLVLIVDFCLLLYFFAGITDVDWASPLSADLVFAVLLAAMVTVLSYGFLAFAGHRLRSHKDHSGAIPLADLDGLTRMSAAAAIAAIAVLAALMFARMRTEVLDALGPHSGATALLIALTLAVVSALANFLVVAIHALDGSDQAARLEALSGAAGRSLAQAQKFQQEADSIPGRIAVERRRAIRDAARAIADADRRMTEATQIIDAAHAHHQAAGPYSHAPAAALAADLTPLRTALEHISADLPDTSPPGSP